MQTAVNERAVEGPSAVGEKSALAFAWETIEALGADQSLSEILQSWALAVVKHLDANLARVWTMSPVGLQLQATAEANTLSGDAYTHMPVGAFIEEIADECRPYATNDIRNDPHLMDSEWAKREHLRAFAGHPLMSRGKLVGVAAMVSKHPVSDVAMQALSTSAGGLALTIRRKRVEASAKEAVRELKAKNTALISANRRSQALIDLAPSGILVVDREGTMTVVNSMAERLFGFVQSELLGQPADMLLPELLRGSGAFTGPAERDLSTRTDLNGLRKDGSTFPVEIGLVPIEPGGDMRCCIVDITDRADTLRLRKMHAELRAASERSLQVIESVPNGIVVVDHAGAITLINARAEKMFGFNRQELVGQPVEMLFPESMRSAHVESGGALTGARKDGSEFALEISLNPIPVDGEMSVLWSIVDTTERTLAESRLREAARLKSEFLANMSHEIRTPINVMVGMSGLLLETDLTPDQKDLAETIRNGAESLLVVINDSLDFSKMEAGKLEIDPADFEVDAAVEDVTSFFSQSAARKGLALNCLVEPDVPRHVYGDGGRLRQILTNLVGNAIKFTERGEISLRVSAAGEESTALRFEVKDSGIGISAEAQQRIFQAFTQADGSTTRKYGGTGLGLAIVKHLIEMMGGAIGVESEPGRGSTFWFQLPLERAREAKGFDPESSARMVGVRTLVTGEDGAIRLNLTEQLESWGMKIEAAGAASEAVARLREAAIAGQPFGLVVVDYRMKGIAGMIRSEPATADVPIVMLASREDRKAAAGINGAAVTVYLTAPPRTHHLHKTVAMALLPVQISGNRNPAKLPALPAGPRLLLVEDNIDNQKLTVRLLGKYGYSCDIASNGAEALKMMMRGCDYPLILMDCQMPEMDGFQATAAIREREGTSRHTPIVAMTAHALEGDRDKCLRAGMDDYIAKPVTEGLLVSTIERWAPSGEVAAAPAQSIDSAATAEEPAGDGSRVRVVAKEGLEDLIPEYLANCTKSILELAEAVAKKDLETARAIGHGMKGCGAGYGFAAITDFGRNIEDAAAGNDEAAVAEQISKLGTYLAKLEVIYP